MKIQELAIIFIIIILPISLLLSEYTQFQINTIKLQTEYDTRLTSATYDAIKAFQLNEKNESYSDLRNMRVANIEASVNAFRNSIMAGFKMTGYTEDDLNNYIPALLYTLYDGFYIYSPYENVNYRYYKDLETKEIITKLDATNTDIKADDNGEFLYGLKPYISYSCRYQKGTTVDVVITYALDNYVTVQGKINGEYVNKSGYLIDNLKNYGEIYNGVVIQEEALKENLGEEVYYYAKINGTKYYLKDNCIVCNSNGSLEIKAKEGEPEFDTWKSLIINNDSAKQYYKKAYEFTNWFKNQTSLRNLKYSDAIDEVVDEEGKTTITKVWPDNNTLIFDFNPGNDAKDNIENELSDFNQHRLAVIRHKIETNLAIAISNYNTYSGAKSNVFQMPELKENEWDNLTNKISLISFMQGLPIGGKIYNGYALVTNSESTEVVLEENIYILGQKGTQKVYYKIGDNSIDDINAGIYGMDRSAGRLNLDFKSSTLMNTDNTTYDYYYPLEQYNASYDSVVMQNNVTVYDDIYEYVNNQDYVLKQAFYTALGRERYGTYKEKN